MDDRSAAPVVVFEAHSDVEASIVRGLLDAHGIPAVVSSDMPHAVFPLTVDVVRIAVRPDHAAQARRIISAHTREARRGELVRFDDRFESLETRIGYRFRDRGLLEHALTHSSHAQEDVTGGVRDNESLEFLGDAILGFAVSEMLFRRYPTHTEGQKSKMKAALVSRPTLARLGTAIRLGECLLLGRGEEKSGGRHKQALVANAYEALIAAIFLDGGIEAARQFVTRQFEPLLAGPGVELVRDYKSELQEWLQARGLPPPDYQVTGETGPPQRRVFHVDLRVKGELKASATGHSKKHAEQQAAKTALERLAVTEPAKRRT